MFDLNQAGRQASTRAQPLQMILFDLKRKKIGDGDDDDKVSKYYDNDLWLLWFPANRVIGGQVPGVLVAQAEIIQTGKSSHFDSDWQKFTL